MSLDSRVYNETNYPLSKLEQADKPNFFVNHRYSVVKVQNLNDEWKDMISISGTAIINLKGNSEDRWNKKWFKISVEGGLENYQTFQIEQKNVLVVPTAVYNVDTAKNAGWAIDASDIGTKSNSNKIFLDVFAAVRDVDGYLFRVGYYAKLIGKIKRIPMQATWGY